MFDCLSDCRYFAGFLALVGFILLFLCFGLVVLISFTQYIIDRIKHGDKD